MSIFTKASIKKARKKVLSFITAFAITGTMLSYAPVIKENMGYDISEYSASAEGAESENTGGTGSSSTGLNLANNGTGSAGQGRMGLLVYPIILSDNIGGIEPSDFDSLNRWASVQQYGTYVEVDGAEGWVTGTPRKLITSYDDTVKKISLINTNQVITMSEASYIGDDTNAFATVIKNTINGFGENNFVDLSEKLNNGVNNNKGDFYLAWQKQVNASDTAVRMFNSAIADGRFMWGVEILGELKESDSSRYMVPVSDICTLNKRVRGDSLDTAKLFANVNDRHAWSIASVMKANGLSFCPSGYANILYGATAYLNMGTGYGSLGCLRPYVSNDNKWDGDKNKYAGWGIITISADEAGIASTNYQVIETATLIAGKDTGYATADRDSLLSCSTYLEKNSYAQNGVVANFVNRVSSVWVMDKTRGYYEVALTDASKNDGITEMDSLSVYPDSMIAGTPLEGTEFEIDKSNIKYKAILSDGSAETDWISPVTDDKELTINGNKVTAECLIAYSKNEDLKVKAGTYKGQTIQDAARSSDKDIFFIVNAPYVYDGLSDDYFKTFNISENKLTSKSSSLLNFINTSKAGNKLWVQKANSVGSLYGQISDVGLPKFADFFKSTNGLSNNGTSSKNKTTYFLRGTTDKTGDEFDKANNVVSYYADFEIGLKVGAMTSSLKMYPAVGESTNSNKFVRDNELSANYDAPRYSDDNTRYRYEETGTDGSGVVSRAYIGDVVNIAKFSKFNNVANGVNLNTAKLAVLNDYGFVTGYVPGTRVSESKNAGFVRATSTLWTGSAQNRQGLVFNKFKLSDSTLGSTGEYYKSVNVSNAKTVYINALLRKASVDTKINLHDDVYEATSKTWTPSGKSEVDTGFSITTSETLKFYPEVKMQYDTNTSTNNDVYVVGDEVKTITPIVYNDLSIESGEIKVDSSAIAVDSRAKQLAKDLGFKDVPVYLTGGVITGSTKGDKLSISSYIIDISDTEAKKAWDSDYDAASIVKDALSNNIKKVSVTPTVLVDDGKDSSYKLGDKAEADIKEVGTPELAGRYLLTFESGKITSVYYWKYGETTANELELNSDEVKQVLAGTQVETALKSVMDTGKGKNGWFNEDTSVICINKYTTEISLPGVAFSDKLPLDAGPKSAETKDKQFNKGYKAYVSKEIEVLDKDGNKVPVTVSVSGGDTPNFIIPNVSVIDVAQ